MAENTPVVQAGITTEENQNPQTRNNVRNDSGNRGSGRPVRLSNRNGPILSNPRDFEGAKLKIGGILALQSENMTKKVNYDQFFEKFYIYIMNNFRNRDAIVEVTKKLRNDYSRF